MFNTKNTNGFLNSPACPSSHPVRVPQVAYETVWDTTKFNALWKSGQPNPYVWSFEGKADGSGTHADYLFGWKGDSLQRAMDKSECFYDGCGAITKQQMSVANQCQIPVTVMEETDGCEYFKQGKGGGKVLTVDRAGSSSGSWTGGVGSWGVGYLWRVKVIRSMEERRMCLGCSRRNQRPRLFRESSACSRRDRK